MTYFSPSIIYGSLVVFQERDHPFQKNSFTLYLNRNFLHLPNLFSLFDNTRSNLLVVFEFSLISSCFLFPVSPFLFLVSVHGHLKRLVLTFLHIILSFNLHLKFQKIRFLSFELKHSPPFSTSKT